ncbi:hypothetical protein C0995_001262 [Termitomyces sp. Mi166|nr:hypothetical protein C0995_001262 [Termitomyces sp. Mi166\
MSSASVSSPTSILDTDLYKLTMQQAVLHHFPDVSATYRFTNRDKTRLFSRQSAERFRTAVSQFTDLILTQQEREWLQRTCPYLKPSYLSFLASYRYKPEQVRITFVPVSGLLGNVEIEVSGPWIETILWEVPLMATLSECFFNSVDVNWNYDNQEQYAYAKSRALLEAGCTFSEFGTRRRRSYHTQDLVVRALVRASRDAPGTGTGRFSGTSNVAAINGYENTHSTSLGLWEAVYPDSLLIALTDTFTTHAFFKDFTADPERAQRWRGLRQDSGDPFAFGPRVKEMYESLGIDPRQKAIIYSDSLSVDKAIRLQKQANELGFEEGTGGTEKSKALNIVIKLSSVNNKPCIKISDDLTKNTGDQATVEHVKRLYKLIPGDT